MGFEYYVCSVEYPDLLSCVYHKDVSFAAGTGGKKVPMGVVFLLSSVSILVELGDRAVGKGRTLSVSSMVLP